MTKYLFLYGTLLPGHAPAEVARTARKLRWVGTGQTAGRLYDFGDYPGAIFDPLPGSKILGQVYEMVGGMNLLRRLDAYEQFDERHPESSLFVRRKRLILIEDGRRLPAWVYEYNRDPSQGVPIPGSDYREYIRARRIKPIAGD